MLFHLTTSIIPLLTTLPTTHLPSARAVGAGIVGNYCRTTIFCAKVQGYHPDDTSPHPSPNWEPLPRNQRTGWPFNALPMNTSMNIQCTTNPFVAKPQVTILEWTWRPDMQERVWFDVSNVDGRPFIDHGFSMHVQAPRTAEWPKCFGAACPAGAASCEGVYDYSTEDADSMRACPDWGNVYMDLCRY